ncbi:FAD-dependent oxidoreductase, partial [Kitasatospora herbaricolor]|uniref:FAD-dependent oxidoreductase n=1 Tax=Kitasatospora herbaricolor TaxID=68217 RepID=UPI0036D9CFE2
MTKLRLAIVGAGPAGIYAADILLKAERSFDVSIDLFEQLPAPYGLVRYGVAPDHPRIKGIITALREVLDRGDIRLFGNVTYGRDITLDDLKKHYNAVIFSTGAVHDADLDIPGIDLHGSYGAADFVSWFDGHPDVPRTWPLEAASVAVIGNGNVALDVSRILAKHADDLLPTEIPDNVYEILKASPVTDVHVFGRRGPAQVKFTPLELRELGELNDVDMILYDEDFDYDEQSKAAVASNKQVMVIDRVLQQWRQREVGQASRRLHLHFYAKPLEVVSDGNGNVAAYRYERTAPDGEGGVRGTGEIREVPVQAIYRAVGYFGSPLDGIPFDKEHGVIPNHEGQVLRSGDNERMYGVYATGWIKRGPVGLIGHTKSDAMETIKHVINDQGNWWAP